MTHLKILFVLALCAVFFVPERVAAGLQIVVDFLRVSNIALYARFWLSTIALFVEATCTHITNATIDIVDTVSGGIKLASIAFVDAYFCVVHPLIDRFVNNTVVAAKPVSEALGSAYIEFVLSVSVRVAFLSLLIAWVYANL